MSSRFEQLDLFALTESVCETAKRIADGEVVNAEDKLDLAEMMWEARRRMPANQEYGAWWRSTGIDYSRPWRAVLRRAGERITANGRPVVKPLNNGGEFSIERYAKTGDGWIAGEDDPTPSFDPIERDPTDDEREMVGRVEAGETVVASYREHHAFLIAWAEDEQLLVRIDRRSDWGNPFEIPDDGDRKTVIKNFERHYLPHKPGLLVRLPELRGKVLACWCAPEPCHGDVLKRWAER